MTRSLTRINQSLPKTRESEIQFRNPNKYFHIIIIMSALFGKITTMNSHRQKVLTKNVEIEIQTWRLISITVYLSRRHEKFSVALIKLPIDKIFCSGCK